MLERTKSPEKRTVELAQQWVQALTAVLGGYSIGVLQAVNPLALPEIEAVLRYGDSPTPDVFACRAGNAKFIIMRDINDGYGRGWNGRFFHLIHEAAHLLLEDLEETHQAQMELLLARKIGNGAEKYIAGIHEKEYSWRKSYKQEKKTKRWAYGMKLARVRLGELSPDQI